MFRVRAIDTCSSDELIYGGSFYKHRLTESIFDWHVLGFSYAPRQKHDVTPSPYSDIRYIMLQNLGGEVIMDV